MGSGSRPTAPPPAKSRIHKNALMMKKVPACHIRSARSATSWREACRTVYHRLMWGIEAAARLALVSHVNDEPLRTSEAREAQLHDASRAGAEVTRPDGTFTYPSYVEDIMGPMCFDYGFGPFRWVCTSGSAADLEASDRIAGDVIEELARKIARSEAQRVFVYGDGDNPDTGEQLAREISGKGIRNVFFIEGGARTLQEHAEKKR